MAAGTPDLGSVERGLDEVLEALASGVAETRNARETIVGAVDGLREHLGDDASTRQLRDAIDRVAGDLDRMADDVARVAEASTGAADADSLQQLSTRLDALQSAVDSLRTDEALHEAELRLARRVDRSGESIRAKIDDQRALADSLAANVSQLNAALTLASEEPQQLRRDLDRILEQLAERMGEAMRELRSEVQRSDEEPLALRSSVEAGLDRISGRFQNDTGRILQAVTTAQDDTDVRLRRIDAQVIELRRELERVRRDAEPVGGVNPG